LPPGTYFGIQVPGFVSYRLHKKVLQPQLGFPLIVEPIQAAAKAGMEYCDFIQSIVDAAMAHYERA
jgi:hypothetical protein